MRMEIKANPIAGSLEGNEEFLKALPFKLTECQTHVVDEIQEALQKTYPMNRLLQGDVGSGKTVVAAYAIWGVARSGFQSVLMAPTEILAEQHYRSLTRLLEPLGVRLMLLTKSISRDFREKNLAKLKSGKMDLVIGTHAILNQDVVFKNLTFVVVDEQHKFGVDQRCQLLERMPRPHQLVMTATPIPRTLAFTLFGDLDMSVMRQLPEGRKPITTYWIHRNKQPEVFRHILERLQAGEQAYIVFPVIEETERADLLAAKKEFERLKNNEFKDVKIGLIHGKLKRDSRDQLMTEFRAGRVAVLVATSVIEVGLDHPNATMMIIENAERFGLAQLHQLRGRIGRGQKASECFLFGEPKTDEGKKRLRVMTKTQDGFVIAEEDLKLRGPGDLWGTRQSGKPYFRVAHPIADYELLIQTRKLAKEIVRKKSDVPLWSKRFLERHCERYDKP